MSQITAFQGKKIKFDDQTICKSRLKKNTLWGFASHGVTTTV